MSNKRNEIKLLQKDVQNVGGQTLLNNDRQEPAYERADMQNNKYLVETVLMDDLIDQIPLNANGLKYEKAVIKIDIEGYEPFAFEECKKLFALYDIRMIFMELVVINDKKQLLEKYFNKMLEFLYSYKLQPHSVENAPLPKKTRFDDNVEWPRDVIWKKID